MNPNNPFYVYNLGEAITTTLRPNKSIRAPFLTKDILLEDGHILYRHKKKHTCPKRFTKYGKKI